MGGCTLQAADPVVTSVDPAWAWTGEETDITVHGDAFFPTPVVDANSTRMDEDFVVELQRQGAVVELEAVDLDDWESLSARVPEGLEVGTYDLVVRSPDGEEGRLDAGFTITDNRADHLQLEFDARPYQVDEQVVVRINLLDPLDGRVPEDFGVTVRVWLDDDEEAVLELSGTGLGDAIGSATELTGSLNAGDGWVALSASSPANVWIGVEPSDLSSPVSGDEAFVPFTTGELDRVQLDLVDEGPYEAGAPFSVGFTLQDEFGNDLLDKAARLTLADGCGGTVVPDEIDFVGSVLQDVTFLRATGASCTTTRLEVQGTATGESAAFAVSAGDVALLEVSPTDASPAAVTAGEEELTLRIVARDAYLNTVEDYARDIDFRDDVGGLDSEQGIGSMDCLIAWNDGERYCSVGLERAAAEVFVEVVDSEGLSGWSSSSVEVVPAVAEDMYFEHGVTEGTAGAVLDTTLDVVDRFDNLIQLDLLGTDPVSFDDGAGTLSCAWSGMSDGSHLFACSTTTATEATVFTADVPSRGLAASTASLRVVNGALADFAMTVPASTVAGESFTLSGIGRDAYGNAYTEGDPSVELRDDTDTLSPVTVTLDGDGLYSGTGFQLTVASDEVTIAASQGGTDLGSAQIEVLPGDMSAISVEFPEPWVWVGDEVQCDVRGVDAYGNTVPDFAGPVTLSSNQGLFIAETVNDFTAGEAEVAISWDSAGLQDRVVGTSTSYSGTSVSLDALDDDCADGPGAELLLDGGSEAVSCILSGTASASADFSGSTSGTSGVAAYHFHDGDDGYTRSTSSSTSITVSEAGGWLTELVVADTDACGDRATAVFWANDKGEAAGPLSVTTSQSSRTAGGSAATADATITVTAEDCAGDVPTVTEVYVRTDLGEMSSGVTALSDGLALSLSGTSGTATWSAQNIEHDGTATIHAGVLSGAAHGSVEIVVSGESARPRVSWVDPSGTTAELFDEMTVAFSETLLESVDYDALVTVTGPSGELDLSTSVDDDELTVLFDSQQDADSGSFTLQLSANIRDTSGNKLDGDFDGTNASYSSVFGDVDDDGISVDSCSTTIKKFTPDGNAGSGVESDEVDLSVVADATPEWWLLEVYDASSDRVRSARSAPTSSTDTVSWDGRGDDGMLVRAGTYRLDVSTIDAQDNVSVACEGSIRAVEHYVALK